MVIYRDQWVFPDYLPLADGLNGWCLCVLMSHIRSQSGWVHSILIQKSMTVICDARLTYGKGRISPVFKCGAVLSSQKLVKRILIAYLNTYLCVVPVPHACMSYLYCLTVHLTCTAYLSCLPVLQTCISACPLDRYEVDE